MEQRFGGKGTGTTENTKRQMFLEHSMRGGIQQ